VSSAIIISSVLCRNWSEQYCRRPGVSTSILITTSHFMVTRNLFTGWLSGTFSLLLILQGALPMNSLVKLWPLSMQDGLEYLPAAKCYRIYFLQSGRMAIPLSGQRVMRREWLLDCKLRDQTCLLTRGQWLRTAIVRIDLSLLRNNLMSNRRPMSGPILTDLPSTKVNSTHWKWVYRCQNCISEQSI